MHVHFFRMSSPGQELAACKKFSDSLLSRSAKLHNQLAELEESIPETQGADKKKAQKSPG